MANGRPAPLSPINRPEFVDALLGSVSEGVVICDSEGKLLRFNRAACRFHQIDESLSPDQLAHELDGVKVKDWAGYFGLCRLDKTPMAAAEVPLHRAFKGEPVPYCEMLIHRKDGTYLRIVASAAQIYKDGQLYGAVATMRDITDLYEVERHLSQLLGNVPGMAYHRNAQRPWVIDVLSEGSAELTGYTRIELLGRESPVKWDSLIHPEDIKRYIEATRQDVASNRPFTVIYRILCKDGSYRWIWERGSVFGKDGVESYLMDYEDRKKLEEDLERKYDAARSEANRRSQDNSLRLALTWCLIIQFLLANVTVLVLMILQWAKAGLSDTTLLGFFGGTVAELAGIVVIVCRYLFPSGASEETNRSSAPPKDTSRSAEGSPRSAATS